MVVSAVLLPVSRRGASCCPMILVIHAAWECVVVCGPLRTVGQGCAAECLPPTQLRLTVYAEMP